MQEQINKIDNRLDKHSKRISNVERLMWVCVGLGLNNLNLLELITK